MRHWLSRPLIPGLTFIVALAGICLHAAHYYPFIADDALISLRYSYRLVGGDGLTWTDGQPVEGYSNLLWVLLTAMLHWFGMDLIDASRLLGIVTMGLGAFSLVYYGHVLRESLLRPYQSVAIGLLFFCGAAPIAIWAIGGMEQPLYAGLIALSIVMAVLVGESNEPALRRIQGLSLVLGLICLTRPDGPIFVLAAFLSIPIARRLATRPRLAISDFLWLALFPVLLYGGQVVFRFYYYGELVPNTALVKIAPSMHHFEGGMRYVGAGLLSLFPFSFFVLVAVILAFASRRGRARVVMPLLILVLWMPYIAVVGGDIFPGYRHFVPVITAMMFILVEGTDAALERLSARRQLYRRSFWPLMLAASVLFVFRQVSDEQSKRAVLERWEFDGQVVGQVLNRAFEARQPVIAVTAAGCVPYWSKLPAIDMLGLNDYYLPRHPPADFGEGVLAHELGDGNYVLSRRPDIVVFHTGERTSWFRSAREMLANPEFSQRYAVVTVLGTSPHKYKALVWFHKYSQKIGITESAVEIRIPGFLFGNENAVTSLNDAGKLILSLPPGEVTSLHVDSPPGPGWTVEVTTPTGASVTGQIVPKDKSFELRLLSTAQTTIEVSDVIIHK